MLINDTVDAVVRRKSNGELFITAEAQLGSISQSLGINESIFGGIGNKKITQIRSQKEVTSTLRNALFDLKLLSMTQGVTIEENGTAIVYEKEEGLEVADNEGVLEVTIKGQPKDGVVQVRNTAGDILEVNTSGATVTIPEGHANAGDRVSVYYHKEVTGNKLELESDKFSEAYEIEYRTIGYDPDTQQVMADIYIQLDHAIPSSDFELSFENGTAQTPEITFDCAAAPNTNSMGRVIVVPREN